MEIIFRIGRLILILISSGLRNSHYTTLVLHDQKQTASCVSQTSAHARVIYPFSESDKPRSLNVIVLFNGSCFQDG